jgi:hypothetical protein
VFAFDAPLCSAAEIASAPCSFFASWPIAWMPPEPHAQSEPRWAWPAACFVPFRFAASAAEETLFDCETLPASPGLWTRTAMFSFDASFCSAADRAAAVWSDFASCPIACVPEPDWAWFAPWCARFRFPAAAAEETLFDCSTSPSSPGLWTRTEMFEFFAPDCSAFDAAAAVCSLSAS